MQYMELPLCFRKRTSSPFWIMLRPWRKRPISFAMLLVSVLIFASIAPLRQYFTGLVRESKRAISLHAKGVKPERVSDAQGDSKFTETASLWAPACAGEVLFFIRCRASDFPVRARAVLDTWGQMFPREDLFFVSGDPVTDTVGAQVFVEPRIGADPLYNRFSVHDPLILPLAWKQLQQRDHAKYIMILEIDTFVLPDTLCSYAIAELSDGRSPYNDYIYSGFGVFMGPPWGANAAGSFCLEPNRAPRRLTDQSALGTFAIGQNGVVLSRKLVRDLAPYAEVIWAQTKCIDAGDMRLWMGMYFHEHDALQGHQVRHVTPCFALTAPGNIISKYATTPPEYSIQMTDYDIFYATFPQTSVEDAQKLWKLVQKLKISALSAGDIMLGFLRS